MMFSMGVFPCISQDKKEPDTKKPYPEYKTIEEIFGKQTVEDFKAKKTDKLEMPSHYIYIYQNTDKILMSAHLKYEEINYNAQELKKLRLLIQIKINLSLKNEL